MQISIIIPNRNGAKTLEKCLESICAQTTGLAAEIILVDDASTDESIVLVQKKFPLVKIIKQTINCGAAKARNIGIKNASGKILLFVDNDVFLEKFCLGQMLESMPGYDIVYPLVLFEDGRNYLSVFFQKENKYIKFSTIFMLTRESLDKLDEWFDENYFIYFEDVDFFMRCWLAGLKSNCVENAIACHAITGKPRNLTHRFYLEIKNILYCMLKFSGTSQEAKQMLNLPTRETIRNKLSPLVTNYNIYILFPDHDAACRLSSSRFQLLYLVCKATVWNLLVLPSLLIKRKNMRRILMPNALRRASLR